MARLGAFCFPGTGHINPMAALARALERRGHHLVIYGIADTEERVRATGIEFCLIGGEDYPPGTLRRLDDRMSSLKGLASFHFTVERVTDTARMILRDGPDAVRRTGVEALLVDEADFSGTIADYLGLPFVSIALIPPFIRDNRIPPFFFGWPGGSAGWRRLRNEIGIQLLRRMAAPIFKAVNERRRDWGLRPFKRETDAFSPLAQVTQLPLALEFDLPDRPAMLHYTGPWVDPRQRPPMAFPWEKLDGRPLVYASLGTLQNGSESIFRAIAAGCAGLPVQLVLSLGGGLAPEKLGQLAGDPLVVPYAPQLELVKRAALVITHGGVNTVLESLSEGVPMVLIPLGNDQPGVAARVVARGAGKVVPRRKLNANSLKAAVQTVSSDVRFRESAGRLRDAIRRVDGLEMAADIIEHVLALKSPRPAPRIAPGRAAGPTAHDPE